MNRIKQVVSILLMLCCIMGLTACSQTKSDIIPEDYVIGVIRTIGNKNDSEILYFNSDLEQTGNTHYNYATMGELFYPPVVYDGSVYIVPQGQATKKDEKTILQLDLDTLEQQRFALDQIAIYGVSVDSSAIYAVNNINYVSYLSRIDKAEKTVKTLDYNGLYVSSAYVYNDMLYAFSSSQDIGAQSTIHCINPSTMVEEKQIDITALGCDVRTVVGVGDILYFVVCSDSNGDFNNIVGAFNTATGEVSTIEFQKNVFHLLNVDNKLYVSHGNLVTCEGTALSVYDIATTDITTYDLGVWIGQIAVNGESLYVMGQHQIAKYDLHTLEKQAEKQIALNSGYYLSGIFANLLNSDR